MDLKQYNADYVEFSNENGITHKVPPTVLYKQLLGDLTLIASNDNLYIYDDFFDRLLAENFTSYEQFEEKAKSLADLIQYKPLAELTASEYNEYFKKINARIIQANSLVANLHLIDEVNSCSLKKQRNYVTPNRLILR